MSATNRGGERIEGDRYMTPGSLAAFLTKLLVTEGWVSRAKPLRVLEPHAGRGSFVRAVRRELPATHITANDSVDEVGRWFERGADDARVGDFLRMEDGDFDLVIGNPPYSTAEAQIRHSLKLAPRRGAVVAFLLRLAMLESQDRIKLWARHPASAIYVLSERPSFSGGSTDQTAYAFFVWKRGWTEPTRLYVVSWRK